jgi:hypothetical protein
MHWTSKTQANFVSGAISALDQVQKLSHHMSKLQTKLRLQYFAKSYAGSPDDIFIVSHPKSGTTLVQMLLYQLLTDGEIRFKHISSFSPYLERDLLPGPVPKFDVIAALPRPHVIKSHLFYAVVPKGPGRYIYVMRNGLDVAVSWYHQMLRNNDGFEPEFNVFLDYVLESKLWFQHVAGWSRNRQHLNVLYVSYEDLLTDLQSQAQRVADFCGLQIPDSEWPRICANCSFEFMRQHEQKLDDLFADRWQQLHFIRKGVVGGWREVVTPQMLQKFHAKYDAILGDLALPGSLRGEGESAVPSAPLGADNHRASRTRKPRSRGLERLIDSTAQKEQ